MKKPKRTRKTQVVGRRFGPKLENKILALAGRDDGGNRLVWMSCGRCLGITTVRLSNTRPPNDVDSRDKKQLRKPNQSCGCFKDELVRQRIQEKIETVPRELRLRIWAAGQFGCRSATLKIRFAEERRTYRLDKYTWLALFRSVQEEVEGLKADISEAWLRKILALRPQVMEQGWNPRRFRRELRKDEVKRRLTGLVGSHVDELVQARSAMTRWGFMLSLREDVEVGMALSRFVPRWLQYLHLAEWLSEVAEYTQDQRDSRRKAFLRREHSPRPDIDHLNPRPSRPVDPRILDEIHEAWVKEQNGEGEV